LKGKNDSGQRCRHYDVAMKAIHVHEFGPPDVLRLEDVPVPVPGTDDVLVRVVAAGVNPVETYIRSGNYARLPKLPFTPGTDAAGIVESLGANVRKLAPGDRVYLSGLNFRQTGTYAQFVCCEQSAVHELPDGVGFAQGAALGVPYLTAALALFERARLEPGETLLVHGASGGVGLAALQFARAQGAVTIGSAGTDRGAELVAAQGATAVNHGAAGYQQRVLELTGGRGVDVVVEMLANVNLARDFDLLTTRGRIVVVGNRGSLEFNPRLIMAKEATVLGTQLWNLTSESRTRLFARLDAGLATGVLRPVVGREFPLAATAEAHRAVLAPGAYGKIVLVP
jgi:NADPH2:quinone reductase